MKTFKQFITEMAAPTDDLKKLDYYHGTTSRTAALGIAKEGIKAQEVKSKGHMAPVTGKAYITPHIDYAQMYAMGGNIAGSDRPMSHHKDEPYGYVFKVKGHKLKDVQPDEDSVGEAVHKKTHWWLNDLANRHLTDNQLRKVKDGEYPEWARSGKKLVKYMNDDQKTDLIKSGAHVAHGGDLEPDEIYRIHHSKIKHLKKDGSNFFEHAEKINKEDI